MRREIPRGRVSCNERGNAWCPPASLTSFCCNTLSGFVSFPLKSLFWKKAEPFEASSLGGGGRVYLAVVLYHGWTTTTLDPFTRPRPLALCHQENSNAARTKDPIQERGKGEGMESITPLLSIGCGRRQFRRLGLVLICSLSLSLSASAAALSVCDKSSNAALHR